VPPVCRTLVLVESPLLVRDCLFIRESSLLISQLTSISRGHPTIRRPWTRMVAVTALPHLSLLMRSVIKPVFYMYGIPNEFKSTSSAVSFIDKLKVLLLTALMRQVMQSHPSVRPSVSSLSSEPTEC